MAIAFKEAVIAGRRAYEAGLGAVGQNLIRIRLIPFNFILRLNRNMIDKKQDKKAYAHAEKAYMQGTLFPYIKVGMQKVNLTPTVNIVNGEKVTTPNAPVYIYDTSGPFSDPNMEIDLKKGLPRMRESWIIGRGDVEN